VAALKKSAPLEYVSVPPLPLRGCINDHRNTAPHILVDGRVDHHASMTTGVHRGLRNSVNASAVMKSLLLFIIY
jgi:hypothetical protein